MVVPRFVQQALRGEPLTVYGDGQQSRCFCDVDDVVRAIVGLAECDDAVGNVFNVGSTAEVTILELARKVLAVVGATPAATGDRITLVPYDLAYAPGFEDTRRRVPDISRVRAVIGWQPRIGLDDTLRRVVAYYRQGRESRPDTVAPSSFL
jgi:UDP-glucose 4-epimerase